jgi:hypothetical protein
LKWCSGCPYSPDLNPIEQLWDELGRRVAARRRHPEIRQMLIQALQEECERIPQQTIRKLVQSLRRRCVACVRARGGHTCYWKPQWYRLWLFWLLLLNILWCYCLVFLCELDFTASCWNFAIVTQQAQFFPVCWLRITN